jgi:hypothetical protein
MNKKILGWILVVIVIILGFIALKQNSGSDQGAAAGGAFDQYGYNRVARIFNGTGASWCTAKGLPADCMGAYSPDKLVMKWTSDWDRGNVEAWANPPYADAWIDNEWNGKGAKGGSGAVWHYKIKWIGTCTDGAVLPDGGYCVWGQFETVMDQGVDPNMGPGHTWVAHAKPNGYGF